MKTIKHLNIPLYLVLGFNVFTIIVFLISPYNWMKVSPAYVVIYILINLLFLSRGYLKGIKKHVTLNKNAPLKNITGKLTLSVFIFYTVTFLIKYAYLLRYSIFDIKGMFNHLLIGFYDPRLGYYLTLEDTRSFTVSWSLYTLISIINQSFFIYGFLTWRQLKTKTKTVFVFYLFIELFYWYGRGTVFGIVLISTTLLISIFLSKKITKINFKAIIMLLFLFMITVGAFGFIKNKRAGGDVIDLQEFNLEMANIDENHFIFDIIPESLIQTYMHANSYFTQGYYHLGLAFNIDFSSTYFLGNNPTIISLSKLFGVDLWENTYMSKLSKKEGVSDVGSWHSAYLWFANDVSLFGVPFILYLLGFFTGYSYKLAVVYNDLISSILFVMLINIQFFLFANNTFLAQYYYSFIVLFIFWLFSRILRIK